MVGDASLTGSGLNIKLSRSSNTTTAGCRHLASSKAVENRDKIFSGFFPARKIEIVNIKRDPICRMFYSGIEPLTKNEEEKWET